MSFTEKNSVEHFIIHQLSGVNLNAGKDSEVKEEKGTCDTVTWKYIQPDLLEREITEVFLEKELKAALIRLNPAIAARPERAEEVIHKLRSILITVNSAGLVGANQEFARWLRNEISLPIGRNNEHVTIKLLDFETLKHNSFIVTSQFKLRAREVKIPDIVLFVNGIPLVVGEAKTPVRPAVTWFDAAHDINMVYEHSIPQLFVPNVFSFATEGK
jgi:type I restriction enzyme R subunit